MLHSCQSTEAHLFTVTVLQSTALLTWRQDNLGKILKNKLPENTSQVVSSPVESVVLWAKSAHLIWETVLHSLLTEGKSTCFSTILHSSQVTGVQVSEPAQTLVIKWIIECCFNYWKAKVYLVSAGINLPVSDTVVLSDLLALWDLLGVGSVELDFLAVFEVVVLVLNLAFLAVDGGRLRLTFSPSDWLKNMPLKRIAWKLNIITTTYFTLKLHYILANILVFPNTSLLEGSIAALFGWSFVLDDIPEWNIRAVILQCRTGLSCQKDESCYSQQNLERCHAEEWRMVITRRCWQ